MKKKTTKTHYSSFRFYNLSSEALLKSLNNLNSFCKAFGDGLKGLKLYKIVNVSSFYLNLCMY